MRFGWSQRPQALHNKILRTSPLINIAALKKSQADDKINECILTDRRWSFEYLSFIRLLHRLCDSNRDKNVAADQHLMALLCVIVLISDAV